MAVVAQQISLMLDSMKGLEAKVLLTLAAASQAHYKLDLLQTAPQHPAPKVGFGAYEGHPRVVASRFCLFESLKLQGVEAQACSVACMQVKQGRKLRPAKSTTKEEIQDIIKLWWPKAQEEMEKLGLKPLLSMDNIKIQKAAKVAGIKRWDKVTLPPYSPDMHKVVEHFIGNLKGALHKRLYRSSSKITSKLVQELLREIFYCKHSVPEKAAAMLEASKSSLDADSNDLVNTYKPISMEEGAECVNEKGHVVRGVGGGWPKGTVR